MGRQSQQWPCLLLIDYIYFYQVLFLLPINKTISFVPHREARSSGWHRAFPSFYAFNFSLWYYTTPVTIVDCSPSGVASKSSNL